MLSPLLFLWVACTGVIFCATHHEGVQDTKTVIVFTRQKDGYDFKSVEVVRNGESIWTN